MTIKIARGLVLWLLTKLGFKAITLPPFGSYMLEGSLGDTKLLRHHAAHWRQGIEMGPVRYYTTYLWWLLKVGYENHPMEVQARAAEEDLA